MTTNEQNWVKVTSCSSVPLREGRCIEIAGRAVAIFHTSTGFLAVENRCPHGGGPLADGIVSGPTVVCPLHAWKFDLCSGASTNHPEASVTLITYPTRVEDGAIWVDLPKGNAPDGSATLASEHRDLPIRWVQRKALPSVRNASNSTHVGNPQTNPYACKEF
jgi:nitrite reductase (NADH) small subunit